RIDTTSGAYAAIRWEVDRRVAVTPGVRLDAYSSGSKLIPVVEPRLTTSFSLAEGVKVVLDLGVANQRPSIGPPLPGFVPTLKGGLQTAYQSSVTVNVDLGPTWGLSTTLFQHSLVNATDYLGVPEPESNPRSTGHSYGLEVGIKRQFTKD